MDTKGEQTTKTPPPGPHLDAESWRLLQAREPRAVAWFRQHLATPCEVCEAFLAEAVEAPDLDALADEALLAATRADTSPSEDSLGWERVRRRLWPSRRLLGRVGGAVAVALAAMLLLFVVPKALRDGEEAASERLKGVAPLVVELSAVARLPDGSVHPVSEGEVLPEEAVVLLRYHASEAAQALLVREVEGAPPVVLGRFPLESGTHDLRDGGELAGVSLEGEQGVLTLVLEARSKQGDSQPGVTQSRLSLRVLSRNNPR